MNVLQLRQASFFVLMVALNLATSCTLPDSSPAAPNKPTVAETSSTPTNELTIAQSQSLYRPTQGSLRVGVIEDMTLSDSRRNRQLPLRIYYPQGQGPYPAIIFSHGGGGSNKAFSYLGRFWATHGYVAIYPSHNDEAFLRNTENDAQPLEYRPQDISFIINSLQTVESKAPQLRGKINRSRIGVAGHSLGAYSTLWVAGQSVNTSNRPNVSFRDNRVRAFLAISPAGIGRGGLEARSWSQIAAPVMTVAGSEERGGSWRREPFDNMPAGDKYFLLIEGAYHSSFNDYKPGGRRGLNQDEATVNQMHTDLENASLAFFDAYLKQDNAARQYLQTNALPSGSVPTSSAPSSTVSRSGGLPPGVSRYAPPSSRRSSTPSSLLLKK